VTKLFHRKSREVREIADSDSVRLNALLRAGYEVGELPPLPKPPEEPVEEPLAPVEEVDLDESLPGSPEVAQHVDPLEALAVAAVEVAPEEATDTSEEGAKTDVEEEADTGDDTGDGSDEEAGSGNGEGSEEGSTEEKGGEFVLEPSSKPDSGSGETGEEA
jgi:hypothetical protein